MTDKATYQTCTTYQTCRATSDNVALHVVSPYCIELSVSPRELKLTRDELVALIDSRLAIAKQMLLEQIDRE